MKALWAWLAAAYAVRPMCRNPDAFSDKIDAQMARLLRLELDGALKVAMYHGTKPVGCSLSAPAAPGTLTPANLDALLPSHAPKGAAATEAKLRERGMGAFWKR